MQVNWSGDSRLQVFNILLCIESQTYSTRKPSCHPAPGRQEQENTSSRLGGFVILWESMGWGGMRARRNVTCFLLIMNNDIKFLVATILCFSSQKLAVAG